MNTMIPADQQPTLTLNDGTIIPQLGFGTWQISTDDCYDAVRHAISVGYRRIDTAVIYGNEKECGDAIRDAIAAGDVTRQELTLSTKVWNTEQGFDSTLESFQSSLERLGLDYVDLYFVHWPCPEKKLFNDTFKAMMRLQGMGQIQSVAVCNFYPEVLDELIADRGLVPSVNQIELHPDFAQAAQRAYDAEHGIVTEAWTPLGRGALWDNPVLTQIAQRTGHTVAQVILRWHIQSGLSVLTRSRSAQHIEENYGVLGFSLSDEDMAAISALDGTGKRTGPDPLTFN